MVPGVVVRDRGSRQGTSVNGTRIGSGEARHHVLLVAGDNEVAIGCGGFAIRRPG